MAKEYDPPPHRHDDGCYRSVMTCTTAPHSHDDHCHNYKGRLTCTIREHAHGVSCYTRQLNCGR
jgi:hypothetical protein